MQYTVKRVIWNGRTGRDSQFDTNVIMEVDPAAINPVPAPLFDTMEDAQAYAEDYGSFQQWASDEANRLRDATTETYNANRGLREYHEAVRRFAQSAQQSSAQSAPTAQTSPVVDAGDTVAASKGKKS